MYDAYPPEDPAVFGLIPVADVSQVPVVLAKAFVRAASLATFYAKTVVIVCPAVRKEVAPKTFTIKSLPSVFVA